MNDHIEAFRVIADEWEPGSGKYGAGPWAEEPDRAVWRYKGVPCMIVRNPVGALCGYAGVHEGHPWFEKDYDDVPASVHGGLTFAKSCENGGRICHVPKDGEPRETWWLGFDCAHSFDHHPGSHRGIEEFVMMLGSIFDEDEDAGSGAGDTYRDIAYVRAQVESLADQALAAVASPEAKQ